MMGIISIIIIVPSFSHLFFHHFLFPRGSTLPKKKHKKMHRRLLRLLLCGLRNLRISMGLPRLRRPKTWGWATQYPKTLPQWDVYIVYWMLDHSDHSGPLRGGKKWGLFGQPGGHKPSGPSKDCGQDALLSLWLLPQNKPMMWLKRYVLPVRKIEGMCETKKTKHCQHLATLLLAGW